MKARIFVVNQKTLNTTIENKVVSVFVPEPKERKYWNKTLIDIASDLLQIEVGDYIFLWLSGDDRIYGVFRCVSKPFFENSNNSNDIFKIKIKYAYKFNEPIDVYDAINNPYMKNKLWNIIGKKVSGKSRASLPITIEETQFLIQSLIDKNDQKFDYYENWQEVKVENEIVFDYVNLIGSKPDSIKEYIYKPILIREGDLVKYEKALEGLLNLLFRDKNEHILNSMKIDRKNVIWYANYLPYGLERSEIDYMVMESFDGTIINRINVIELMIGQLDIEHIKKCLKYSKWVVSSITNDKKIVRPIIICGGIPNIKKPKKRSEINNAIMDLPKSYGFEKIDIYTYSIKGDIQFAEYQVNSNE